MRIYQIEAFCHNMIINKSEQNSINDKYFLVNSFRPVGGRYQSAALKPLAVSGRNPRSYSFNISKSLWNLFQLL